MSVRPKAFATRRTTERRAVPLLLTVLLAACTPYEYRHGIQWDSRDQIWLSEASQVIRERRVTDFAWIDPRCLWRPSIHHVPGDPPPPPPRRNTNMTNIWGLAYASTWYDAFGHRIPLRFHRDGVWAGRLLILLGLLPTAAMLLGFAQATREALRWRGESDDAPLVAMTWVGVAAFVSFVYVSPTIGAPKAIYLLPLAVPAVFDPRRISERRHRGSDVKPLDD